MIPAVENALRNLEIVRFSENECDNRQAANDIQYNATNNDQLRMNGGKKKRKSYDHSGQFLSQTSKRNYRSNPKRGGPAMLLACETGLERKCFRDGLDILMHYYKRMFRQMKPPLPSLIEYSSSSHKRQNDEKLTLEEEIQLLKDGKSVDSVLDKQLLQPRQEEEYDDDPFQVYETGIGGIVLIIYTRECPLDPVEILEMIMQDLKFPDTCRDEPSPRSRFVTRMIPLQTTCFTSMDEIQPKLRQLLSMHMIPHGTKAYQLRQQTDHSKTPLPTFKVEFRRRYCNHITRDSFIDWVIQSLSTLIQETFGDFMNHKLTLQLNDDYDSSEKDPTQIVNTLFKVDLNQPDFTIMIEICKNICGISIIKDMWKFNNFNLIEAANSEH